MVATPPAAEWAQNYEASPWVRTFARWGDDFPPAGSSESEWHEFASSTLRVPTGLVLVSICTAIAMPLVLCCCHPQIRSSKGTPPWGVFASASCMTFLCLCAGAYTCVHTGGRSFAAATNEVRGVAVDVWKAKRYAKALNTSGVAVLRDLDLMYEACPQDAQDYLGNSVRGIERAVSKYNVVACHFASTIRGLPRKLVQAEQRTRAVGAFYAWYLALPSLTVVLVCCAAIAFTVVVTEYAGPRVARRCQGCQMPCLGLSCVAPCMVLVSVIAAVELSMGIQLSAFCSQADSRTLQYAAQEFGTHSYGFNMTRFYITNGGQNPALGALTKAQDRIGSCIDWMEKYKEIIERTCPQWQPWNVTVNLQALLISLNETQRLLAPPRVYGHYRAAVHEFGCGSTVSGLGWLVLFQVLLCLVCLPTLACTASCLLKGLMAEREMGHRFDLIPQEEDMEDSARYQVQ